jgi:putative addiction module component (TIGR02574 family)
MALDNKVAVPNPPEGFDELPVEDQILYVESLWNRIAADPRRVPVPSWHKEVLEERLADAVASQPWNDLRDAVRAKFTRAR